MLENLKIGPDYDGFLFLAESARNPPVLQPHHHVELEINLVADGNITYVVEGKSFHFPRFSLLWFFPSQEHQLVDRSADARYYVAVFRPEMIEDACRSPRYAALRRTQLSESGVWHTRLAPDEYERIRLSMDALLEDGLDADLLNREAGFGLSEDFHFEHRDPDWLNAGLRHLLLLCGRQQIGSRTTNRPVDLHPAVLRALDAMNDSTNSDDLDALARQCGVSPAYLSRTFHSQIGVPLSRYRNSVRLGRFWEAYRRPGRTNLTEAAYAAGFGSYAQFYRIFTQAYGRGPRGMRL